MNATHFFKLTVRSAHSNVSSYEGFFLQSPTRDELCEALKAKAEEYAAKAEEYAENRDDEYYYDQAVDNQRDLTLLVEVVKLSPVLDDGDYPITVAGVDVGKITIETIPAWTRCGVASGERRRVKNRTSKTKASP